MNEGVVDLGSTDPGDERLQLQTRIAWMYYVENETQDSIARRLGMSRMRVNRLLTASREAGIVRIEIASPFRACVALESRLQDRYGLKRAIVVPTPSPPMDPLDSVGVALGRYLGERIIDGVTIGVQHGRSGAAMFNGLPNLSVRDVSVVSLIGGLTDQSQLVPHEVAPRLALHLSAQCFYLAAPTYLRDPAERERLIGLQTVRAALDRAQAVDIAVVTVSRAHAAGRLVSFGFVTPTEMRELIELGAVGAVLGHFVDRDGVGVDHPLNAARIGLPIERLRHIPEVVVTGVGAAKVPAFRALLQAGMAGTMVTDEETASALLAA